MRNRTIILYDGVCGFCDRTIQIILQNKPDPNLRFAAFQSQTGIKLSKKFNIKSFDSIIVIENDQYHYKSSAIIKVASKLQSNLKFFQYLKICPKRIRDFVYDIIAKHRYKLMGKIDQCRIPTPQENEFFMD